MELAPVLVGVTFTLVAAVISNFAPILQKGALGSVIELSLARVRRSIVALFTSPRWLAGFILKVIATAFFLIGLAFLGLAVAIPLLSCGIIVLVYFAVTRLGERLKPREIAGIALLASTPVLLVLSGVGTLQASITAQETLVAFLVTCTILLVTACLLLVGDRFTGNWLPPGLNHAIAASIISIIGGLLVQAVTSLLDSVNIDMVSQFLDLVVMFFHGEPTIIIAVGLTVAGMIVMLAGAMVQQIALQKGKATLVVPVDQSILNLLAILCGFLIFRQTIASWLFYTIAIAFMFAGILLLARLEGQAVERPGTRPTRKTPTTGDTAAVEAGS